VIEQRFNVVRFGDLNNMWKTMENLRDKSAFHEGYFIATKSQGMY
jgi:hypothetical protein